MTADAGADGRAMTSLQATVKDLGARLVALETARAVLEGSNDAFAVDRAACGLAEMSDKIDADTPGKVPAYESDKLKERKLTAVE